MGLLTHVKTRIKATPLAIPYIIAKNALGKHTSQSNEADILNTLAASIPVPKTFVEFGFSGWEFNCIKLAQNKAWQGLLIDGDGYNATIARTIFHRGIEAERMWLTLENLGRVEEWIAGRALGILSVDVDGNDYWFLRPLLPLRPAIVSVEVNVPFGLRPITVPYDAAFDRFKKHESAEYYGASLSAMQHLCRENGYTLVAMSSNGVNAFFVRNDMMVPGFPALTLGQAHRAKIYPDGAAAPSDRIWEHIKHLPYVDVTESASDSAAFPCSSYPSRVTNPPLSARTSAGVDPES